MSVPVDSADAVVKDFAKSVGLSPRESEVLLLVTHRITTFKSIGSSLGISPLTVNNHFKSIFLKTKTNSKADLLAQLLSYTLRLYNSRSHFSRRPHVLVVDDDADYCAIIKEQLCEKGLKVRVECDPSRVPALVRDYNFDSIICDVRMPKMSGFDLLTEIRRTHPYAPTVIFVTGHQDRATEQIFDQGAVALIEKPFTIDQLIRVVMEHFIEDVGERDRLMRREAALPVKVNGELKLGISDIGCGGVFISTDQVKGEAAKAFERGRNLSFSFRFEDDEEPIGAVGEVVWSRTENEDGLRPGVGVKFREISAANLERVNDYVRMKRILSFIPIGAAVA